MLRANHLQNLALVAEFQHHEAFSEQLAAVERAILDMRTQILAEELPFPPENDNSEDLDLFFDLDGDGSLVFDNSELSEWEDDISDWDDFSEVFGSETLSQCLNAINEVEDQEEEEIFRKRNLLDELFPLDSGDSDASDFSSFMMLMASREAAGPFTAELNTYNEETLEDSVNRFLDNLEVELIESSTDSSSLSSELRQFLRHVNGHIIDSENEENEETIEEQIERFFETLAVDLENFDPEPIDENMEFMPLLHNHPTEDWLLDLPAPTPEPSEASSSSSSSTLSTVSSSTWRAITRPELYPEAQEFFKVNELGDDFVNPFTQPRASRTSQADSIEDISPHATPRPRKEAPFIPATNPARVSPRQPAMGHPVFYSEARKLFRVDETSNEFINPFTQHPPPRKSPVRGQAPPIPASNPAQVRNINPVVQPNDFIDSALTLEEQDITDCWLNSEGFGGSF